MTIDLQSNKGYGFFIEHVNDSICAYEFATPLDLSASTEEKVERSFDAVCVECNAAYIAQHGGNREAILGTRVGDLVRDSQAIRTFFATFYENSCWLEEVETSVVDPNGHERWFVNSILGENQDGKLVRIWHRQRNITQRKQVEASLRASERKLRCFVEQSSNGMAVTDEAGRIVEWNAGQERITGLKRADVLGQFIEDVQFRLLPQARQTPDHYEFIKSGVQTLCRTGVSAWPLEGAETELRRADGTTRYVYSMASPIQTETGYMVVATLVDLTERKRSEDLVRIQLELGTLLGSTSNLAEAIERVLETVCRIEAVDCGGVYLVNPVTGALDLIAYRGLSARFGEVAAHYEGDSAHAALVRAGRPIYGQYDALRPSAGAILESEGLHALAVIPIQHEGQAIALLNLASHTQDDIPMNTRVALEALAAQIGSMLARLRAEAALQESQQNLQVLFDTIDDFLSILSADGHIVKTNPVVGQRLGYTAEELAQMTVLDMHPPERRAEAAIIVADMLAGRAAFCSIPLMTKTGEIIPVETRVTRGRWGNQDVLFGISRDITERQRAEAVLAASEKRYRELFEKSSLGIFQSTPAGKLIAVNAKFAQMFGYESSEDACASVKDVATDMFADPGRRAEIIRLSTENPGQTTFESRYRRKDGSTFFGRLNIQPITDSAGDIQYFEGFVEDITERKLAEDALQEKTDELDRFFNLDLDLLCIASMDGYFLRLNTAWERTLGYRLADLIGVRFLDLVHPADQESTLAAIAELAAGRQVLGFINRYRCRDGSYRWIEWHSVPYQETLIYAAAHDITARRQAEEQRIQLAIEQQRMLALQEFIKDARHDLMMPLSIIKTCVYLARKLRDEGQSEQLDKIDTQTNRLLKMLQDMLLLLELDAMSAGELVFRGVNLNQLVETVAEFHRAAAAEKSLTLLTGLRAQPVVRWSGDEERLSIALGSLVENAVLYTGDGGTVRLSLTGNDEWVIISVSDNGSGIAEADLPHIFERFYRAEKHRPTNSGAGLGLSIAQRVVELHGGKIDVESLPGQGSTFRVSLPAAGRKT